MNGRSRDDISSDVARGYPTLSSEADAFAADVLRLSTFNEWEAVAEELARRTATSPSWAEWMQQTGRYLADFDPGVVRDIERYLRVRRDELRERARSLGWDTGG